MKSIPIWQSFDLLNLFDESFKTRAIFFYWQSDEWLRCDWSFSFDVLTRIPSEKKKEWKDRNCIKSTGDPDSVHRSRQLFAWRGNLTVFRLWTNNLFSIELQIAHRCWYSIGFDRMFDVRYFLFSSNFLPLLAAFKKWVTRKYTKSMRSNSKLGLSNF